MTLTTWLLVFGGLSVTAIMIDGIRRMFASHAALKIDIDESLCDLPIDKYTSELPNGGARVVTTQISTPNAVDTQGLEVDLITDLEPAEDVQEQLLGELDLDLEVESIQFAETIILDVEEAEACVVEVETTSAEVELEDVFVLDASPVSLSSEENTVHNTLADGILMDEDNQVQVVDFDPTRPVHELVETNSMVQSDLFAEQDLTELTTVNSYMAHELMESSDDILFSDTGIEDFLNEDTVTSDEQSSAQQQTQDESLTTKLAKVTSMTFGKNLLNRKRVAEQEAIEVAQAAQKSGHEDVVEQVISILVTSNDNQGFYGPQLRQLVEACGLVYGEMNIFHRFEDGLKLGKNQFSMANMMEPGTFDLIEMDHLHTPGVVFFMGLPTAQDSMQAFDYMLETAQCLAANLGGEVLDEQRSVMRPQTIEHCRQQVREFERRHMTRRAQL